MRKSLYRRSVVGGFVAILTSGCLEANSENNNEEMNPDKQNQSDSSGDTPNRCELQSRTGWGEANPIKISIKTNRSDDLAGKCVDTAADAALQKMAEQLDYELEVSESDWIQTQWRKSEDEYIAEIVVIAEKNSNSTGDGSYRLCPPSTYSFEEALEVIPREVTVTLQFEDDRKNYTCTHRVRLKQSQRYLD
jgi:hypothetical protein